MALTATPTRMMRRGDSPPFQEREYTSKNAIIPPKNANRGVKKYNAGKNAVISTATRLAPELIPIIPGSASGFFITACKSTPETAMAAPPNIAIKIRGKRRSNMVATFSLYATNSPLKSSRGVTFKLPVLTEKRKSPTSSTAVIPKEKIFFLLLIIKQASFS